ncbi:hypothetical protein Aduo_003216 [Ancylostoma duodenale]
MLIHYILILALAARKSPTSQATADKFDPPYGCSNQTMGDGERLGAIREIHDVRQNILLGRVVDSKNTTLPTASDMYKLAWSCALEDLAHALVKDCNDQSKPNPNYALSFRHYNQTATPDQLNGPLTKAIEEWRAQISSAQWPADQLYNTALNIPDFANMIHAKTTAVGCAEAKCVTRATAACFYDQPTLQNGELIYTKGTPCVANDQCKTYQPSTCASGFCVKGDPLTTPVESSSSETTPSSTSSESTTPSSTASESIPSNSTSPESSTPSSTSSESTTLSSTASESTSSNSTSPESSTPSSTSSKSTTPSIMSSESTTPSITSSESGATPNSTASESTTLGETSPSSSSPTPSTVPTTTPSSSTTTSTSTPTTTGTTTTNAHKDPSINQICPSNWGVNDKIRNKTLEAHNYRRSQLALGQIRKRNGNYYQRARDMIKLKYSCQLEVSARDHAVTCRNRPSSPSTRPNIEENVARIPKNSVPDRVEAIRKAITLWWKTGRKEKPIGVALTFRRHHLNSPIRHFTKMAWAQTREIGCAVRDCGSSYIAVCHYKPGGNIINHKIYEAGRPCSRCPANARCSEGLCVI